MAVVNARTKEINAKIVYYGPGRSGKTTNIKKLFAMLKPDVRGKLMALSTQSDRTIFFDYLPVDLGSVRGMKMKIQLYTVPGQVFYNSTRRLVLKNVDGIVFVADSSRKAISDNLESLANLQENLQIHNMSIDTVPWVIQYNKRDEKEAMSVSELHDKLNRWNVPEYEAIADSGQGVMTTLTAITKLVVRELSAAPNIVSMDEKNSQTSPPKPPPPAPISQPDPKPASVSGDPFDEGESTLDGEDSYAEIDDVDELEVDIDVEVDQEVAVDTDSADIDIEIEEDPEIIEDATPVEPNLEQDLAEIPIEDADVIEEMEEIVVELGENLHWEQGTLIVPVQVSMGPINIIREFRVALKPSVELREMDDE